jgi:hypothetical protein
MRKTPKKFIHVGLSIDTGMLEVEFKHFEITV